MHHRSLNATAHSHRPAADAVVDYAIFLLDPQGQVSSWNPGAQRINGYTAEEVVGKPFSMFFAEADRRLSRPERNLEAARLHGRCEAEGWRVRKDGSRFWALAVLDVMRDEAGTLTGFAQAIRNL